MRLSLRPLMVLAGALSMCAGAFAGPCQNQNLQLYVALAGTGCQIDDKLFLNFAYTPVMGASPLIDQISVIPINTPGDPGLTFTSDNFSAGIGATTEFKISYTVMVLPGGHLMVDNELQLNDPLRGRPNGSITITESKCLGGSLANCPPGSSISLSVFSTASDVKLFDRAVFGQVARIDVSKDIVLVGGSTTGTSFLSVNQTFSETPEPAPFWITGGVLLLAMLRGRRGTIN